MAATTDKPDAADSHVDVSLMKLPNVQAVDKEVPTGEEGETEIYSQCVPKPRQQRAVAPPVRRQHTRTPTTSPQPRQAVPHARGRVEGALHGEPAPAEGQHDWPSAHGHA